MKEIQVSLSENVKESVELNQKTLCVYELNKGLNSGMTEHINLEISGNDKGDDQKGNVCILPILLQLPHLAMPHYSSYSIK